MTASPRERNSSTSASKTDCSGSCPLTTRSRRPPTAIAISANGPSGRGVHNPSHAPTSTCAPAASEQNAFTSALLPTPASPDTSTSRPRPQRAEANASSSVATASSARGGQRRSAPQSPSHHRINPATATPTCKWAERLADGYRSRSAFHRSGPAFRRGCVGGEFRSVEAHPGDSRASALGEDLTQSP